jgi:chemotaxis receptor (MCP) glutamine deamidase CheD
VQFGLGDLARLPEFTAVALDEAAPGELVGTALPDLPRRFVHGGMVMATADPTLAATILGSCVAVCVCDSERRVGGLNHFVLPWEADAGELGQRHGRTAIESLIAGVERLGAQRWALHAKLFGGASVLNPTLAGTPMGARNIAIARESLTRLGIPVVAEDVGGTQGRKLFFHTGDGSAWVRKL